MIRPLIKVARWGSRVRILYQHRLRSPTAPTHRVASHGTLGRPNLDIRVRRYQPMLSCAESKRQMKLLAPFWRFISADVSMNWDMVAYERPTWPTVLRNSYEVNLPNKLLQCVAPAPLFLHNKFYLCAPGPANRSPGPHKIPRWGGSNAVRS